MGIEIDGYAQYRDSKTHTFKPIPIFDENGNYPVLWTGSCGADLFQYKIGGTSANKEGTLSLAERQSLDVMYGMNYGLEEDDEVTPWRRISLGALKAVIKTYKKSSNEYRAAKHIEKKLSVLTDLSGIYVDNTYDDIVYTYYVSY